MAKRVLGPGSLSIGEVATPRQFGGDTSNTQLVPSTDSEDDIPLLDGSNESGEDTTTWSLNGTVLDDYTLNSLAIWCAENAGKELPFEFVPSLDEDMTIGGVVKVRPIGVGGDVKSKNTQDFEFPLVGQPTWPALDPGV